MQWWHQQVTYTQTCANKQAFMHPRVNGMHTYVTERSGREKLCVWMQLSVYAHWETEHTTIPFLSLYLSSLPLANETGEEKKRDVEKTSEKGCLCVHAGMDTKCTWPLCMCVCNRNGCERNVVHVKALAWICKLNDRISANTLPLSVSLANSRTKRHTHAQMHTNMPIYAHFAHIRTHTYKKSQNYAHLLADEYTHIKTRTQLHTCTFTLRCWHYHLHTILFFSLCLYEPTCTHAQVYQFAQAHLIKNFEERKRDWDRETKKEGMFQDKMHKHACIQRVHGMHASVYE